MASSTSSSSKPKSKSKKPVVADSWEDEESSSSEVETEAKTEIGTTDITTEPPTPALDGTAAPPPTPISPTTYSSHDNNASWLPGGSSNSNSNSNSSDRRPEKTDAVARRMIAGALGLRAPRATEEQKAYDRAVREKERKRREEEREAEKKRLEEVERAKNAMWND